MPNDQLYKTEYELFNKNNKTNTSDFSEQILSEIDSIADQRNGKRSIRSSFS